MRNFIGRLLFPLWLLLPLITQAQITNDEYPVKKTVEIQDPFSKRLYWNASYNQLWSTIEGKAPAKDYFIKPSVGVLISAEYFPLSFVGITAGIGYQQRGAGISNPNKVPVTGLAPDSAYRERLRFNTVEFPIGIILRTPKDIFKGFRFSFSGSIVPMINVKTMDTFNELEAGIRNISVYSDVSPSYFKNDLAYQFSLGPEIDCGGSGIFRVHFLSSKGTQNVYAQGQGNATNRTYGVRITWLFPGKASRKVSK